MDCLLSTEEREEKEKSRKIDIMLKKETKRTKHEVKLLLLGIGESGKSTFMKQMRILHGNGYNDEERLAFAKPIVKNVCMAMQSMITAMVKLDISYDNYEHESLAGKVFLIDLEKVESIREPYTSAIRELWSDAGVQECYRRRSEYQLIDSAEYFLSDIDRIGKDDYLPSEQDVLRARVATSGILTYEFLMDTLQIKIIDVGGQKAERRKWIHCFDYVNLLMFVAAISEYDQTLAESQGVVSSTMSILIRLKIIQTLFLCLLQSRIHESKRVFREILSSEWFLDTAVVLFLNKIDQLDKKIMDKHLVDYLPDYDGPQQDANAARQFILQMYMDQSKDKDIYAHFTCATGKHTL
ncbi:hypothetical protein KR222_006171 [Zaprionus bogoriensis]|nr:hypothetical protein KR222_006171 [Zaprionus bogoriensis]